MEQESVGAPPETVLFSRTTMDQLPAPASARRDASLSRQPSNSGQRTFPARAQQAISDSNPFSPWSRKTILCLDGGGVKGYSSLLILKRLCVLIEEIETGRRSRIDGRNYFELNTSSADYPWTCDTFGIRPKPHAFGPNDIIRKETREQIVESVRQTFDATEGDRTSDFLLRHYFDYMAGTSTGGLSAILLSRMGMSVDMALAQYDVIGNAVFGRPRLLNRAHKAMNLVQPKYSARRMEKAMCQVIANGLKSELGHRKIRPEDAPFQIDSPGSRTMVIAYGHATKKNVTKEYLFRTYLHNYPSPALDRQARRQHLNPGLANPIPLYKVARATSAAPRYFPRVDIGGRSFLDGGMVANNPSRLALKEVEQMHEQLPKLLLSLGTGMPDDYERVDQEALLHGKYMIGGFGDTLKAIGMLVTQTEKIHDDMSDLLANPRARPGGIHRKKTDYFRFNAVGDAGEIPLDQWKGRNGETTKARIRNNVIAYLSNPGIHRELVKCAQLLVETRRARAETERWESFAHEFAYFCPEKSCEKAHASRIWFNRDDLREHGTQEHYFISNIPVANREDYPHACLFDSCRYAVTIFRTLEEFRMHLVKVHRIIRPIFKSVEDMERWLDRGRRTKKWAVDRADSNPQKLSRNGTLTPGATLVEDTRGTTTYHPARNDSNASSRGRGRAIRHSLASSFPNGHLSISNRRDVRQERASDGALPPPTFAFNHSDDDHTVGGAERSVSPRRPSSAPEAEEMNGRLARNYTAPESRGHQRYPSSDGQSSEGSGKKKLVGLRSPFVWRQPSSSDRSGEVAVDEAPAEPLKVVPHNLVVERVKHT